MFKTKNIFLTSFIVITAMAAALPAFALDDDNMKKLKEELQQIEEDRKADALKPSIDTKANITIPDKIDATAPSPQTETNKNIFQQAGGAIGDAAKKTGSAIGDAAKKTGSAIGGAATSAWNGTKNFVSGIFKGAEPCNDDATKKLKDANKCPSDTDAKCTDSLVEKTKLDTKQSGTDGQADENGTNKSGTCVVSKCIKGYTVNSTKTGCDKSEGDCTDTAQAQDSNATAGELKKGKCIITECGYGYHPDDDGTKCEQAELSEKGSQEKVDDLKKNAQAMKDKEQSLANRTLSAAAIGTTGIGGMNLLSGMAEQSADEDAERDMKAYLATFACDYGQGRNIKGGEKNIETPGGNDLIAQVTEYRTLAADLKVRKEALGKQPGIESEVIYDIAETGLYDNVGMGRQSGAYTSLSRALTDETSKDAEEWAKQKADTADKVKTGAITAGAGAIGGLIGNLAINSGEKKKNQLNDILNNREYDKFKKLEPVLEKLESNIPPQKENIDKCVGNATGTPPNCKCTGNLIYSAEQGCIPCGQNEELNKTGDACICKDGFSGTPCEKNPLTPKCTLTEENRSNVDIDSETGECKCVNGYPDVPTCACNITDGKYTYENGQCNKTVSERPAPKAELKGAKSMFAVNSSNLTDDAKKALDSFIVSFQEWKEENSPASYCIKIDGHTDLTGSKKYNDNLSQKRADSVKNYLTQKSLNPTYIKAQGHGWAACVDSNGKKLTPKDQPDCRKIVVEVDNKNCDGTGTSDSSDTNIPTNTNNTITSTTPSSTKPSQASTSTTDHTSKAPVEYTLDSADPTDNWPQYVKDKIANIDAAKKAGQYCNGYNQNGIQGHFIFDADYTNPPLMAPHVKAYCIFTKQSKGNLTVSSDNLLSDKAFYNGERYQFSNAAFATAPAPSALKTPLADKYVYIDMPVFSDKTSAKAGWAEKIADKRIGYVYIIMTK